MISNMKDVRVHKIRQDKLLSHSKRRREGQRTSHSKRDHSSVAVEKVISVILLSIYISRINMMANHLMVLNFQMWSIRTVKLMYSLYSYWFISIISAIKLYWLYGRWWINTNRRWSAIMIFWTIFISWTQIIKKTTLKKWVTLNSLEESKAVTTYSSNMTLFFRTYSLDV